MTKEQEKEFEEISKKMIRFLKENLHPHVHVIIDNQCAELSEGIFCSRIKEE